MTETAKNQFKKMNRLHEILAAAIVDARGLDREVYTPNFSHWHQPDDGIPSFVEACQICLAGAVIAGRLVDGAMENLSDEDFEPAIASRLLALNSMRLGDWDGAWREVHSGPIPQGLIFLAHPSCDTFTNWKEFDENLKSLEAILPALREIEDQALGAIDSARGVDRLGRSIDSTVD